MSESTPVVFGCEEWMNKQDNGTEVPGVVDNLAAKVKEASLDPDCNAMCEEMITSWAQKGLVGESCPKLLMMTPCSTKDHTLCPLNQVHQVWDIFS